MDNPTIKDLTLANAVGIGTTKEERVDIINMEKFACMFRQYRLSLGLTQAEVGTALGQLFGSDSSQTTISRFEALNLSYKIMVTVRQRLIEWIKIQQVGSAKEIDPLFRETNNFVNVPREYVLPRRKRTHLDTVKKDILEAYYSATSKPSVEKVKEIADLLGLERDVVRTWFSNKRQKLRKVEREQEKEDVLFTSLKAIAQGKDVESSPSSTNNNTI